MKSMRGFPLVVSVESPRVLDANPPPGGDDVTFDPELTEVDSRGVSEESQREPA